MSSGIGAPLLVDFFVDRLGVLVVGSSETGRSLAGSGIALSALRNAVLNKGARFPLPGSPSQALRASSPKVGALGKGGKSERSA